MSQLKRWTNFNNQIYFYGNVSYGPKINVKNDPLSLKGLEHLLFNSDDT